MTKELTCIDEDAPLNIALAGPYGSGKSSVLLATRDRVEHAGKTVVDVSLPSLGIEDTNEDLSQGKDQTKTNAIQKEVVKQLLYRKKPQAMPHSRFNRLDKFNPQATKRTSCFIALLVAATAFMTGLAGRFVEALPSQWADGMSAHWWVWTELIRLAFLFAISASAFFIAQWAQRFLKQDMRLTEVTAGPAKLKLGEAASYFDAYLDEIVYFFQMSGTTVVIFEDLDRFRDPHIFETLRILNNLLNAAEQTGEKPIQFVYAVRDSIFEQPRTDGSPTEPDPVGVREIAADRRQTATNRTKFFDLVIPMVPFISHRTARDLIELELGELESDQKPGPVVMDIIGAHITDMRLIKNMCNEYDLFRPIVLAPDRLDGLTADKLFAFIAFKNVYLSEYEKVLEANSFLDDIYKAHRDLVDQLVAAAQLDEKNARIRLRNLDGIGAQSTSLGKRLQAVLSAAVPTSASVATATMKVGDRPFTWDALTSAEFWKAFLAAQSGLIVTPQYMYGEKVSFAFEVIQTLMDRQLESREWDAEARSRALSDLSAAQAARIASTQSSFSDALVSEQRIEFNGKQRTFAEVVKELTGHSRLVLSLLEADLIDENFTLYAAEFPKGAKSASAMNFIIKAVQPNKSEPNYHFGVDDEPNLDDIQTVIREEKRRLITGHSVRNIEIFDYLLATDPNLLRDPITRLAEDTEENRDFIASYLVSGRRSAELVTRLAAIWSEVFSFLVQEGSGTPDPHLVDAALSGMNPSIDYTLSSEELRAISQLLPDLSILNRQHTKEKAASLAEAMTNMSLWVMSLDNVAEPLRAELVRRNRYPVTDGNLVAILGEPEKLSLDQIKSASAEQVYPYVLSCIDDYLVVASTLKIPTVMAQDGFAEVLNDVSEYDVDLVEEVARRAEVGLLIDDLSEVVSPVWPAVAEAQRFRLTAKNVSSYLEQHGADSDLARYLRVAGSIEPEGMSVSGLKALAISLANADALRDDTVHGVLESLGLDSGSIQVSDVQQHSRTRIPLLMKAGFIKDDVDAFMALSSDEWPIKRDVIRASKAFPSYFSLLPLNSDDLNNMATDRQIPDGIKQIILEDLSSL
ncbi:MAG: hypothetical protein WAS54_02535, partial [Scrofimicrobium sp.]